MKNFTQVPNSIIRNKDLKPQEKAILIYILSFSEGRRYPSYNDIQKSTGMNRDTVAKWLRSLKEKKVLTWIKGHSFGKNNKYYINPDHQWKLNSTKKTTSSNITSNDPKTTTSIVPNTTTPIILTKNSTNNTSSDIITTTNEPSIREGSNTISNEVDSIDSNINKLVDKSSTIKKDSITEIEEVVESTNINTTTSIDYFKNNLKIKFKNIDASNVDYESDIMPLLQKSRFVTHDNSLMSFMECLFHKFSSSDRKLSFGGNKDSL